MKICVVCATFPQVKCGIGDYAAGLIRSLKKNPALEVCVITSDNEKIKQEAGSFWGEGIEVIPLVRSWNIRGLYMLLRKICMLRPDVVHLQYQWWLYRGGAMITLLPLFIKTCRKDIMVVTTFHDLMGPYLFPKAGRLRKLGIKLLASFSDRIITSNRRDKEELLRLLPEGKQKISYIPIGAGLFFEERRHPDTAKAYAGLRQGDNQVRIAYFGYLLPYKGIEDLLAAAKLLIERQYPVQLMLIGGFSIDLKKDDAYPLMVQGLAKKLGIWERIKWCGHLRPEEASGYLRAADMCILPYSDGVSERRSSFVAVLSHGIPVITTRCQNTPEALVDRENILLVDPGSPAQIAAAAEALINSPKLRQQLAEASRGLYEERYSWEVIADKTLRVYQKQGT